MEETKNKNQYCNSLTSYSRWETREVKVGDVCLGGKHPIRVQSMTTTDTMDTIATVEQSIRMIDTGCEYVRITAPSKKQAENLKNIKEELVKRGYKTPLIADIHFTPNAAEIAARIVEKVRINPGNYADRKKFDYIEYSDEEYNAEIERISQRFLPLIKVCKEYGTAMRIGTNHGSLSDRIMSRYGDTPIGMVESAMEFLRICRSENYHNIVLSMKSSNPIVMVEAYRLLVHCMIKEEMNYPLHLGVTEAGEGQDGRIKSALGIGTLLEDGLGDTIRVSLTEEPEHEVPVAKKLVDRYLKRSNHSLIEKVKDNLINPFEYDKRKTLNVLNIGGDNVPRIINDLSFIEDIKCDTFLDLGYTYFKQDDKWGISDLACDYIYVGEQEVDFQIPGTLGIIQPFLNWKIAKKDQHYPILDGTQFLNESDLHPELNFLSIKIDDLSNQMISKINNNSTVVLYVKTDNIHGMAEQRRLFIKLLNAQCMAPVIVERSYDSLAEANLQLYASTDLGGLFVDGLADGVSLRTEGSNLSRFLNELSFGILQAARARITKTEYISCPSCGRTLFDLQEVTARIRLKTQHLKGLKIAVMGCIVNGPGEMADADFGYVGSGYDKIDLYVGKNCIERGINSSEADYKLIELIKEQGRWEEPKLEALI